MAFKKSDIEKLKAVKDHAQRAIDHHEEMEARLREMKKIVAPRKRPEKVRNDLGAHRR